MENKAYIYKIIDNIKNKVVYVGQHNGNCKYYEGSSLILKRYRKKHGTKNYRKRFKLEIIEYCDKISLDDKEIYYIKIYNTYENGLNLTEGGNKNLAKNNVKGKSFPEKNRKLKGLKRSEESILLMKEAKIGYKPHRSCHENMIKKVSKIVLQYDKQGNFIKEWSSGKEAAKSLNIHSYGEISACCLGKVLTANGFIWKYKDGIIENKITPPKRKTYKRTKPGKGKKIKIDGVEYISIAEAQRSLNITEGKLRRMIKMKLINFKWL